VFDVKRVKIKSVDDYGENQSLTLKKNTVTFGEDLHDQKIENMRDKGKEI